MCLVILVSLYKPDYLHVARDVPQPQHFRAGEGKTAPSFQWRHRSWGAYVFKDSAAVEWCWIVVVGPYQELVSLIFMDFPFDLKRQQEVHIARKIAYV